MPRQLHSLPGGQIRKDLPPGFLDFFFNQFGFPIETDAECMGLRMFPQFFQFALQFHNRLLKIKVVFHGASGCLIDQTLNSPESQRNAELKQRTWNGTWTGALAARWRRAAAFGRQCKKKSRIAPAQW
jgi:hypothetical protein